MWTILSTRSLSATLVASTLFVAPALVADEAPRSNLLLSDVPEKSRKTVEAAVEAYREYVDSEEKKSLRAVIQKLEDARLKAQDVPQVHYYLGICYQMSEEFSRAKSRLERALHLNPNFHEAYVEYGDVFVSIKEFEKAIEQYDKALELHPRYDLALERKATILIRLGKFTEAQEYVQRAQAVKETAERKAILARLAVAIKGPNWKQTFTHETKNYIIKTSISESYAREIAEAAERIRRAYIKVFPKTKRPDRKYPIYIHESREEYIANGGPRMAGGHYEPDFRILQLFQYPTLDKTVAVLNHEAFHQFIHDYIERPPQWFNEGVAEYFGAFEYIPSKRRVIPRPNKDRIEAIHFAFRYNRYPPPADLMMMSRAEMYNPQMASIHYAQAWSLVYFMLEGKSKGYRRLLVKYFQLLNDGKNIEEAFRATFARVDMARFEREWKSFVNAIPSR